MPSKGQPTHSFKLRNGEANRRGGRRRKNPEPTPDDIRLIYACKEERTRLREEVRVLRRISPKLYADRIAQLDREIKELSDAKLAEKFEQTKYMISRF